MLNVSGPKLSDVNLPVIADCFELGSELNCGRPGRDATPAVYGFRRLAEKVQSARALLRLPVQVSRDQTLREVLAQEVSLLQQIRHPRLVAVHGLVRHGDDTYIELDAPGMTLGRLVHLARATRTRIPYDIFSRIVLDAMEGLNALQQALFELRPEGSHLHRELCLEHIWIDASGRSRLLDSGYGRALERGVGGPRQDAAWVLPYASPEQVTGAPTGLSTDTYSLCALLWEVLTDTQLFERHSRAGTIEAILENDVPPLDAMGVRADLSFLVQGLGYDGPERYETLRELAQNLALRVAPATATCVTEWLRRVDPAFCAADIQSRASSNPECPDNEATSIDPRYSELPDEGDELTLIACDVTAGEMIDLQRSPRRSARPSGRARAMAASLGVEAVPHEVMPLSRRQYTVGSVSPKLIERLAAAEAEEARHARQTPLPAEEAVDQGLTSPIQRRSPSRRTGRVAVFGACVAAAACVAALGVRGGWLQPTATPRAEPIRVIALGAARPKTPGARCSAGANGRGDGVIEAFQDNAPATLQRGGSEHWHASSNAASPAARSTPPSGHVPSEQAAEEDTAADAPDSPIVVPHTLHPRINPLMTSKQVFSSR